MTVVLANENCPPQIDLPSDGNTSAGHVILHDYPPPALEAQWLECLAHATDPAHYASPAFFKELYFKDKKPFAVFAIVAGAVAGVLTGLHEGGVVVSGLESRVHIAIDERHNRDEVIARLLRGLEEEARGGRLVRVYSWRQLPLTPFLAAGYRRREFSGNPVLDLSLGAEALLKDFNATHRRNIKLAAKNGVVVTEAETMEEFEAFYAVYDQWCATKGIFRYSKELEWEVFQTTKSNRRLFVAKKDGKVIAGTTVRFFPGGLVEYSRNSSMPEFLHCKPNDLLMWHAIRWSSENSFRRFSMGAHHRFLRGFGGEMTPIDRYRADRTLFRRHDLEDMAGDLSRAAFTRLSAANQQRVRKLLRRENPAGW